LEQLHLKIEKELDKLRGEFRIKEQAIMKKVETKI